jgi:hypothetical protein
MKSTSNKNQIFWSSTRNFPEVRIHGFNNAEDKEYGNQNQDIITLNHVEIKRYMNLPNHEISSLAKRFASPLKTVEKLMIRTDRAGCVAGKMKK